MSPALRIGTEERAFVIWPNSSRHLVQLTGRGLSHAPSVFRIPDTRFYVPLPKNPSESLNECIGLFATVEREGHLSDKPTTGSGDEKSVYED